MESIFKIVCVKKYSHNVMTFPYMMNKTTLSIFLAFRKFLVVLENVRIMKET